MSEIKALTEDFWSIFIDRLAFAERSQDDQHLLSVHSAIMRNALETKDVDGTLNEAQANYDRRVITALSKNTMSVGAPN